jgi:hypothetical protein
MMGTEGEGDDDQDTEYIINNEKCKKIQIEGEKGEFYMDQHGNIYDQNANYVGTANM